MPNYNILHETDLGTDEGVDAVAEELVDVIHGYLDEVTVNAGEHDISVSEWADVRRALIERLTASLEFDKAWGHPVGNDVEGPLGCMFHAVCTSKDHPTAGAIYNKTTGKWCSGSG